MSSDKTALLFGPYKTPALKVGDGALCFYRDVEVVIYDWTMAPIPWPLCYHAGTRAFGKGILVEEELERAIRHESAASLIRWWGVSPATVGSWRRAFGIGKMDAEGSRRLIHKAVLRGLNAIRKRGSPRIRMWTAEEIDLLRSLPSREVANRTKRTVKAVTYMRRILKLPVIRA